MLTWLKRLLFDEAAFHAAMAGAEAKVRCGVMAVGALLASGTITLDSLGAVFGRVGWYAGWCLIAASVAIRAGDRTPGWVGELDPRTVELLKSASPDRLKSVLTNR